MNLAMLSVICTSIITLATASSITRLWEINLPSSTALNIHLDIWINPQSSSFSYRGHDLFAITTVDGSLTMLNATDGRTLWSLSTFPTGNASEWQGRSCGGNNNGLFIYQSGMITAIHPLTSETIWTIPSVPLGFASTSTTHLYLYNDTIILNDDSSIASIATTNGTVLWSKIRQCSNGCGYRVDTVSNSGRVAFFETSPTDPNALVAVVYNKLGERKLEKAFDASWSQSLYMASVDSFTVTVINLQSPLLVIRYPLFTISNFSNAKDEWATGYSLSCPWGGETCNGNPSYDSKDGYTSFFINTNYRTYAFNYTSGSRLGYSYLHKSLDGHLVAMAQEISITEQLGNNSKLIAFHWNTMQPSYNATFPNCQAYDIRLNWYNEVLAPTSQGFYFLFGTAGIVDPTYAESYPAGIVKHNIIVQRDRFFLSSGTAVAAYSFPPS